MYVIIVFTPSGWARCVEVNTIEYIKLKEKPGFIQKDITYSEQECIRKVQGINDHLKELYPKDIESSL